MKKLHAVDVTTLNEVADLKLPDHVSLALKDVTDTAKEGLLALAVTTGLSVLGELLEQEATAIVGERGKHKSDRSAYRHGQANGSVALGGRLVSVDRPRVRAADGSGEIALCTYERFRDEDPFTEVIMQRMLAGVSSRRYRRTGEPVGNKIERKAKATSKSAISRRFIERTRSALSELLSRRLDSLDLVALQIDGVHLSDHCCVAALGICLDGTKVPLGVWEGSSENARVATDLLVDLVERGLNADRGLLIVIDGSKALRRAALDVLGQKAAIQRCIRHKERNVLDYLPMRQRPWVQLKLRAAYRETNHAKAKESLQALADHFDRSYPSAAKSLREGLDETLTVTRLGIGGSAKLTLSSTNPIESMFEIVRSTQRNVKRWRSGDMRLRWTAAGMLEAERQFRRLPGYRELPKVRCAIEDELHLNEEVAIVQAA